MSIRDQIATLEEDLLRTEARQVFRNGPKRAAYAEFLRVRLADLREQADVEREATP